MLENLTLGCGYKQYSNYSNLLRVFILNKKNLVNFQVEIWNQFSSAMQKYKIILIVYTSS